MTRMRNKRSFLIGVLGFVLTACAAPVTILTPEEEVRQFPLIDSHAHIYLPMKIEELVATMDRNGVTKAILLGTDYTLGNTGRFRERVVPFYGIAFRNLVRSEVNNPSVVFSLIERLEAGLEAGYRGIGELHTRARGFMIRGERVSDSYVPLNSLLMERILNGGQI
ncbi:MAG: hypothetical protein HY731_13680 [Candidatus Tectomicrobia bacterium]|nr:hypothetical protein [Candidatus Tectomicrobia bacterium]